MILQALISGVLHIEQIIRTVKLTLDADMEVGGESPLTLVVCSIASLVHLKRYLKRFMDYAFF